MHIRLTLLLLAATALTAAAQTPVKTVVHYPSVYPAAEIHFVDGNVGEYPIKRIAHDAMRVDAPEDQSIRMPLTFVKSVNFKDGCTIFFDDGQFRFDKLTGPARLKNENGDPLLEGVLKLTGPQAESLMGADLYREFHKKSVTVKIGEGAIYVGSAMLVPFMGMCVEGICRGCNPIDTLKESGAVWKGVTIGGAGVFLAGVVVAIIGNTGCNRVVATHNNGLGLAYSF